MYFDTVSNDDDDYVLYY